MQQVIWRALCLAALTLFALAPYLVLSPMRRTPSASAARSIGWKDRSTSSNRDGAELKVALAENGIVVAIVKASLADIKPGLFVGSTAMPQPDGSQKAIEVHIFPEAMRRAPGKGTILGICKPTQR